MGRLHAELGSDLMKTGWFLEADKCMETQTYIRWISIVYLKLPAMIVRTLQLIKTNYQPSFTAYNETFIIALH